ncbi:MAG: hypothetical protein RSC93_01895 [Erysipelotrichaceae bacterium]
MFKELFSAVLDVGLSYSIAEKHVKYYIENETRKWDGYLPVKFDFNKWTELNNTLKSNPDINYDGLAVQDILRQAEILVRCPKIAMKHVIFKEKCYSFQKLAEIFGVDVSLVEDAYDKYYGTKL